MLWYDLGLDHDIDSAHSIVIGLMADFNPMGTIRLQNKKEERPWPIPLPKNTPGNFSMPEPDLRDSENTNFPF